MELAGSAGTRARLLCHSAAFQGREGRQQWLIEENNATCCSSIQNRKTCREVS